MALTRHSWLRRLWSGYPAAVRRPLALLLLLFVALGTVYSVVNPIFEGTDELRHFRFVRVLAETGRLPVQGQEPRRSQSHHPPLYYALSAAATFWVPNQGDPYLEWPGNPFWGYQTWQVGTDNKNMYLHGPNEDFPWSGVVLAAHLARLVNVGLGALAVSLAVACASLIWPRRPALALLAGGVLALNPMFLFMSGAVNNDVAAAAGGAAVTLVCLLVLRDGLQRRRLLALGLAFGLALLAKMHLLAFLPLIELLLLYRALLPAASDGRPRPRPLLAWLRASAWALGPAVLLAGWWFLRNRLLYGDPTGFQEVTQLWGVRNPWESIGLAWSELPNAWSSLWGRFGYGQIPMPAWVYTALAWAAGLGLLGALLGAVRRPDAEGAARRVSLALLALVVLTFAGVLFGYMLLSPAGSMGRFFFPALPALALLLAFGWAEWVRIGALLLRRPHLLAAADRGSALVLGGLLLALSLWALLGFIAPAYAVPAEVAPDGLPSNLDVTLSDPDGPLALLLGYQLDRESLRPGDTLRLTLAWQALRPAAHDYALFIHLLDEIGVVTAQRDTYHGLGSYPTSFWRAGHTFVETYQISVPETAYAPAALTLQVGMYSRDWDYRLETTPATADRAVPLQVLSLEPLPGDLPNPQRVSFDNQLYLRGYAIEPRALRPGEGVLFQLFWELPQAPAAKYGIFLHILGENDRIWASYDGHPHRPMVEWPLESPVEDLRYLKVPQDMPPGIYQIEIGVWPIGQPGNRLPIVADDGHWIDTRLLLSPVRILPEE